MRRAILIIAKCMVVLLVVASCCMAAVLGYARMQGLMLLSVQTGSMQPAIRPSDAVLLRLGAGRLAPGDVVSYRSLDNPKLVITHRVIAYDNNTGRVTTKGDALKQADRVFGADRVIGRVEYVVPMAGYAFDFLRHPAGLAVAVYVPALTLAYGEIRRLVRHYESRYYRLRAYLY